MRSCVLVLAVLATVDGACDDGWQSNFGNLYCFDTDYVTHADARYICQDRNSELASITSDAECDYVANMMSVHFCDYISSTFTDHIS